MDSTPNEHKRRSIRLPEYDYRNAGAYFVTICTHDRKCTLDDPSIRTLIEDAWSCSGQGHRARGLRRYAESRPWNRLD
jgi:hypothetical protein